MPPYRRLQQYAIAISIISVIYNGLEGGVSIGFGAESNSRSLIFFGIQSGIEVISALLVVWRFRKIAKPGEERGATLNTKDLQFEKFGTLGIGILLIALGLGTIASSIAILVLHREPDTSNASLVISASALVIMLLIWLPKRYLATALDSSTMRGEAICSLSCIQLTCVLFIGSLIFRVWHGGWWIDGATSMILSLLFGWEGYKMVVWAGSKEFTGGCCEDCRVRPGEKGDRGNDDIEKGKRTSEGSGERHCCSDPEKGSCGGYDSADKSDDCRPDSQTPCCQPTLGDKCCGLPAANAVTEECQNAISSQKRISESKDTQAPCCHPTSGDRCCGLPTANAAAPESQNTISSQKKTSELKAIEMDETASCCSDCHD